MLWGYARVSALDQNVDRQIDILKDNGVDERLIYIDKFTGTTLLRPSLEKLLKVLHEEDMLMVTSLDRLARSTKDLYELMDLFKRKGILFKSIKENIDFTTSTGKLIFGMFAIVNEFQRNIIIENAKEGYRAGKLRGKKYGRPLKLNAYELSSIKEELMKGKRIPEIAKELNITRQTLYNYLKEKNE